MSIQTASTTKGEKGSLFLSQIWVIMVQVDLNNMFPHWNVFIKFYSHRTMEKDSQGIFIYVG